MQAVVFWSAALLAAQIDLAKAAAGESKAIEIPLKEIWALNVTGTRKIEELEPGAVDGKAKEAYGPLTYGIIEASQLHNHSKGRGIEPNGPGFAVSGTDLDALRAAHRVLTEKQEAPQTVSGNITVVFHSLSAACGIRLDSISRDGKEITIKYHLHFSGSLELKAHFALIPFGKLNPGRYEVRFEETAYTSNDQRANVARLDTTPIVEDIVCKDFSFEAH